MNLFKLGYRVYQSDFHHYMLRLPSGSLVAAFFPSEDEAWRIAKFHSERRIASRIKVLKRANL